MGGNWGRGPERMAEGKEGGEATETGRRCSENTRNADETDQFGGDDEISYYDPREGDSDDYDEQPVAN